MALERKEYWDTRLLHDYILARAKAPYVWGSNDCALFAADGIKAQTGTDIAGDFRGKYSDEAGAYALVKSVTGGTTVADAAAWCAKKAGMTERVHPLMAQRGDLVVVSVGGKQLAGLVLLNGVHVGVPGETGLMRLPITSVTRSWSL